VQINDDDDSVCWLSVVAVQLDAWKMETKRLFPAMSRESR